ncbi:MAG: TetR/AcrR family transcriptional regulator [Alphaproteobacteria bacterium]|nr:TetR/AcrR family transcriptional regulator [Alphaproteobacteria bacterium]
MARKPPPRRSAKKPVEKTGQRERAKNERRLRIMAAARDLIRETGETQLSMRTIAKRANVSLATPYNLFGSKRAVVMAILEDVRNFSEHVAGLEQLSAIERIFSALALATDFYRDDPLFYRTLWKALLDTSGKGTEHTMFTPQGRARNHALWEGLLQDAQDEGTVADEANLESLLKNLSHTFNGVMLGWVIGEVKSADLPNAIAYAYALALRGVATPKGAALLLKRIQLYQTALTKKPAARRGKRAN